MKVEINKEINILEERQITVKDVIDDPFYPDDTILSLFAVVVYKLKVKADLNSALEAIKEKKEKKSKKESKNLDTDVLNFIKQIQSESNWEVYAWAENEKDDYFGAAFWNKRYNQLVISHRGTVPKWKNRKTAITDLQGIARLKFTGQIHSACTFTHRILEGLDRKKIHVSITGHSLGGWLGQITTFAMEYLTINKNEFFCKKESRDPDSVIHCVVIDSPGCSEMLCQIAGQYYDKYENEAYVLISALDITIYFNEPNLVNSCNSHRGVSRLLQIYEPSSQQKNLADLSKEFWFHKIISHDTTNFIRMLKTHSGMNFVSLLVTSKAVEIKRVLNWPSFHLPEAINKKASTENLSFLKGLSTIFWLIKPAKKTLSSEENEVLNYYKKEILKSDENSMREHFGVIDKQYNVENYIKSSRNVAIFTEKEKDFLKYWKGAYDRKIALEGLKNIQGLLEVNELENFKVFLPEFDFVLDKNKNEIINCHSKQNVDLRKIINRVKHLHAIIPNAFESIKKDMHEFYVPLYISLSNQYQEKLPLWDVGFKDTIGLKDFLNSNKKLVCFLTKSDTKNEVFRVRNILKELRFEEEEQRYLGLVELKELKNQIDVEKLHEDANCSVDNLLVIDCELEKQENNDDESFENFIKMIKGSESKKKLILIANHGNKWLEEILQRYEIEKKEVEYLFSDFTENTQKKFFEKKLATLWSKDVNISQFLKSNYPKQLTQNEIDFLSQPELIQFFLNGDDKDSNELTSPYVIAYDDMEISTADMRKKFKLEWLFELLKKGQSELRDIFGKPIMFIISGVSESQLQEILNQNDCTEVISDHVKFLEEDSKFEELCRKNMDKRIYWVQFLQDNDNEIELKKIFDSVFYMLQTMYRQEEIIKTELSRILKEEKKCAFIFVNTDREKLSKSLGMEDLKHLKWLSDNNSKSFLENEDSLDTNVLSTDSIKTHMKFKTTTNMPLSTSMTSMDLYVAAVENMKEGSKLFNEIIKESKDSVHLINVQDNGEKHLWVRSRGSIQTIRDILEKTRTPLTLEDFSQLKHKTVLIVGESGMGKSTLLSKIAKLSVSSWVLWVNLINFRKKIDYVEEHINIDSVIDFLSISNENLKKPHTRALFKFSLQYQTKTPIVIFFDGFDEMNPEVQKKTLHMILLLQQETNAIVYVTAKLWAKDILENELSVLTTRIEKITDEEKKKFIRHFWLSGFCVKENFKKILYDKTDELFDEYQNMDTQRPLPPLHQSKLKEMWDYLIDLFYIDNQIFDKMVNQLELFYKSIKQVNLFEDTSRLLSFLNLNKTERDYGERLIRCIKDILNDDQRFFSHSQKYLQQKYNDSQYKIKEFVQNLIKFFLIVKKYEPEISEKFEIEAELLAIPLQLRMIGEILQREKNFVTSENISRNKVTDVYELYSQFIKLKFKILKEKLRKSLKSNTEERLLTRHQSLACQIFFPNDYEKILEKEEIFDLNNKTWEEDLPHIYRIGIVKDLKSGDVQFNHISFAEYFAAEKIYQSMINRNSKNENLERLVMSNILLKEESGMIRRFLNGRLKNSSRKQEISKFFTCLKEAFIEADDDRSFEYDGFSDMNNKDQFPEKIVNKNGETALHICASENLNYLAESFLSSFQGGYFIKYIDLTNIQYETAFYYTSFNKNLDFATTLLNKGTEKNILRVCDHEINDSNKKREKKELVFAYTKKKIKKYFVLNNIVSKICNDIKFLEISIKLNENKSILNSLSTCSRFTLLLLAIENDSLQDIKTLMEQLPVSYLKNSEVLLCAARKGNRDVVITALGKGADINAVEKSDNLTPVNAAARKENWDIVLELISRGANVKIPTLEYKQTVLHIAAAKGAKEVVSKSLDTGANIDAVETSDNCTPVNIAAYKEHWDIVLELISRGANVKIPTLGYKQTVLHIAAAKGAKEVVSKSLGAGANIDAVDTSDNLTPVNAAACEEHWDIVLELIRRGANVKIPTLKYNQTVLYCAAAQGVKEAVLKSLDAGANIDAVETSDNCTPLNAAALEGNWDIVLELIRRGANVKIPTLKYNQTVLYFAAAEGVKEAVLKSLDAGADIDSVETSHNLTPVNAAAYKEHWDIVLELIRRGANVKIPTLEYKQTVLHIAAAKGAKEVVSKSLDAGANIDAVETSDNCTPLNAAALEGNWDIVLELISRGANVKIPTLGYKQTVLYCAAAEGVKEVVLKSLDAGADIDSVETSHNLTPVNAAAREKHWDIVLQLISRGANVTIPSLKCEVTVLHIAAAEGVREVVLKALGAGANIDAVETSDNCTPVNIAAHQGHWDIVLELISRGANVTIPSLKYKHTVLYIAAAKGEKELVLKALDAGADINFKTVDNLTALNAAADIRRWDIVTELTKRGAISQ